MSKYEPLRGYLGSCDGTTWVASFEQLERILGFRLPASARRHPAWWANQTGPGHVQSRAWQEQGWMTRNVDLKAENVEFERGVAARAMSVARTSDDTLLEQARRYSGIEDRDALIVAALGALVEREAGRNLARRGGTMPELEAPSRRRPEA